MSINEMTAKIKELKSLQALIEEAEAEADALNINYCFRAVEKCAVLRRETPPELNFFGGGGRVIALIPYRLLEGIVAPLRGGVAVC